VEKFKSLRSKDARLKRDLDIMEFQVVAVLRTSGILDRVPLEQMNEFVKAKIADDPVIQSLIYEIRVLDEHIEKIGGFLTESGKKNSSKEVKTLLDAF